MENAVREYAFIVEFFMVSGNEAQELFEQIIGTSLSLLLKNLDQSIQESYDSISLYLCIRLVHKYRAICHGKSVFALERYWDSVSGLLWGRLKHVLRLNVQSVKECDPTKVKVIDQRPHYITRRYAEFSAGILSISQAEQTPGDSSSQPQPRAISAASDEAMASLMADLQQEVEHFILKMTSVIQGRKSQLIFLINNYDMILSILSVSSVDLL